jgi:serine/threonine protein kinase/Tfp pilus assembly protein PilF
MEFMDDSDGPSLIGRRIGVYRLEEEIGRGGMGAVYRASRVDGEFRQTVAIKLIKRGMDTDLILQRFRRERQILATLNHPNIASFLGGGSTEDGLPYFVMEYIKGEPLYEYCDEKRLQIRDRLMIFREICYSVIAAHRQQIVHRDIKPSNILVREDRKPKLLDFGIAKVLDPELLISEIDPTGAYLRVMTPEYASPEQIGGDDVGPASDIYTLGVILYELLTGHRPYRLRRQVPQDAARIITDEDPSNPSSVVSKEENLLPIYNGDKALEMLALARSASLDELRRTIAGDLDKVIVKALRKDPRDRYVTAADLANDITSYLEGRPVKAELHVTIRDIPLPVPDSLSLAVLPFRMDEANGPGGTGDEFLGVGLADALISRLSVVRRLVVRPTSSVLPFSDGDPIEAGERLGVDFVLEGSIRRIGERLRFSVQLLEVGSRSSRWAKAFDMAVTDVMELEETLSDQVAKSLLPELTAKERERLERGGTKDPAAFRAYVRGRYFWNRFTDEYLLKALEAFKEAIGHDPGYALAHIGVAEFYIWSAIFGEIPSADAFPQAHKAALRALETDGSLGEAYAVLAFTVLLYDWNWADAEHLAKKALELSPNHSFAHECYSNFLLAQGSFESGISEIERAEELDPLSPRAILMTAWTYYQAGRFHESVAKATRASEMQADFPQALLHLGNALLATGDTAGAVEVLARSVALWPSGMPMYLLCHAFAANGRIEEARSVLNEMLNIAAQRPFKPYFIAMAYVALHQFDEAFEWFERSVEERNEWMIWFGTDPKLEPLRSDPRYLDILRRTNNPLANSVSSRRSKDVDTNERERSIAVLPFKFLGRNETEATGTEYLSIGLADALTMRLSNVRRFLVRPTSSVLPFGGSDVDPFSAGEKLGVEFVVDGIIRQVAGRIRVTAQLLNVADRSTRWSASFVESSSDVLELEDLISEQVTRSLVPQLTGDERRKLAKRGTDLPQAHDAYLQGRYFWSQFSPDSFPKVIDAFRRAVDLDPRYALAHVGIADYYTWACIYGFFPPSEALPRVFGSASRALEIDPTLAEAFAALGLYYSYLQQWENSEEHYRRAIELNPNYPLGHEWLAALLVGTGRFDEGKSEILMAEQLDPLSLRPKVLSAWTLYQMRDYDQALRKAYELEAMSPEFMQTHLQLSNILLEIGKVEEALGNARRAVELAPGSPLPVYSLAFCLAGAGLADEARSVRDDLETSAGLTYISPYFLAMTNLAAGDIDRAFAYLEASCQENSAWALWLATEPKLDPIRSDPRFSRLLDLTALPYLFK